MKSSGLCVVSYGLFMLAVVDIALQPEESGTPLCSRISATQCLWKWIFHSVLSVTVLLIFVGGQAFISPAFRQPIPMVRFLTTTTGQPPLAKLPPQSMPNFLLGPPIPLSAIKRQKPGLNSANSDLRVLVDKGGGQRVVLNSEGLFPEPLSFVERLQQKWENGTQLGVFIYVKDFVQELRIQWRRFTQFLRYPFLLPGLQPLLDFAGLGPIDPLQIGYQGNIIFQPVNKDQLSPDPDKNQEWLIGSVVRDLFRAPGLTRLDPLQRKYVQEFMTYFFFFGLIVSSIIFIPTVVLPTLLDGFDYAELILQLIIDTGKIRNKAKNKSE
ncbi:unnamed protein product [Cyprideis torosa]|uniref:Uncharacterized protein n=1 Tax=Cyprideis torosa TaxID=163714 RepID=A0A7R8WBX4_9CRUS|nr:unnamed protein product [Cyprideis torosa]CAG0892762.1 unnamed protein product [Cyprideis torosa]